MTPQREQDIHNYFATVLNSITDQALKNIFWSFPVKAHAEENTVSVLRKEIKAMECFPIKFKRLKMLVFRGQTRGIESSE